MSIKLLIVLALVAVAASSPAPTILIPGLSINGNVGARLGGGGTGLIGGIVNGVFGTIKGVADLALGALDAVLGIKIGALNDVFDLIVNLSLVLQVTLNNLINGLGSLFVRLVACIIKIAICILGLPGNRGVCATGWNAKFGISGEASTAADLIILYRLDKAQAELNGYINIISRGNGIGSTRGSARIALNNVATLVNFILNYQQISRKTVTDTFIILTTISGSVSNSRKANSGNEIIQKIVPECGRYFKQQGYPDITGQVNTIINECSNSNNDNVNWDGNGNGSTGGNNGGSTGGNVGGGVSVGGGTGLIGGIINGVFGTIKGVANLALGALDAVLKITIGALNDVFSLIVNLSLVLQVTLNNLINGLGSLFVRLVACIIKIAVCILGLPGDRSICAKGWNAKFGISGEASTAADLLILYRLDKAQAELNGYINIISKGKGIGSTNGSIRIALDNVATLVTYIQNYKQISKKTVTDTFVIIATVSGSISNSRKTNSGKEIIQKIVPECGRYFKQEGYPDITVQVDTIVNKCSASNNDNVNWNGNGNGSTSGNTGSNNGNSGSDNGNTSGNTGSDNGNTGSDNGNTSGNSGTDNGNNTGNTGSDSGSNSGNTGSDNGNTSGNTGTDNGSTSGNTGSDSGSNSGNTGSDNGNTSGNTGTDNGNTSGNTGTDNGNTSGNTGSDSGSNSGNTGNTSGNTGSDNGNTSGNTGTDNGNTSGNTGSDSGSNSGNTGSDNGNTSGNTGSDNGSTGSDNGNTSGNTGSDNGSTGSDNGNTSGNTGSDNGSTGSDNGNTSGNTGSDNGNTGSGSGNTSGNTGSGNDIGSSIGGIIKLIPGVTSISSNIIKDIINIKINTVVDIVNLVTKLAIALGGIIDSIITGLGSILIRIVAVIFKIGYCVNGWGSDKSICTKEWNAQFGITGEASTKADLIALYRLNNCKSDVNNIVSTYTNGKGISSTSGSIKITLQLVTDLSNIVSSGTITKANYSTVVVNVISIFGAVTNSYKQGSGTVIIQKIFPVVSAVLAKQGFTDIKSQLKTVVSTINLGNNDKFNWSIVKNGGDSNSDKLATNVKKAFKNVKSNNNVNQPSVSAVLNLQPPRNFDDVCSFGVQVVQGLGGILDVFINGLGSLIARIVGSLINYIVAVLGAARNAKSFVSQKGYFDSFGVTVSGSTWADIAAGFKINSAKADLDSILAAYTKNKGLKSLAGVKLVIFNAAYSLVDIVAKGKGIVEADLTAVFRIVTTLIGGFANSVSADLGKTICDNMLPTVSFYLEKNGYPSLGSQSASIYSTIETCNGSDAPWASSTTVITN